jgi:hypothetical protein
MPVSLSMGPIRTVALLIAPAARRPQLAPAEAHER